MSTPSAKRRRIEEASHTLAKPFKSPLKTDETNSESKNGEDTTAGLKSHLPPRRRAPSGFPLHRATLPTRASEGNLDPELIKAQQTNQDLERQIRSVREDIDTLEQAIKISKSGRDPELVRLIAKWKQASQAAAEELFGSAKDKINRMGGMASWKEMERRQAEWRNAWDAEDQGGKRNDGNDDSDGEGNEHIGEELKHEHEQQENNDAFTMDIMLRSLHVDLDVIGYDKDEQRWTD